MTQSIDLFQTALYEGKPLQGGLMLDPPQVQQIFLLKRRFGWGAKRIAQEVGLSRTTVRRYLKLGEYQPYTRRPSPGPLAPHLTWLRERFSQVRGNVRILIRELAQQKKIDVGYSTLARITKPWRDELTALALATVRFETLPGQQLQVDFGELFVPIGGAHPKVYFCVMTLGYSRRCFVRAFLAERQEHWLAGLEGGFLHFGGVPRELLIDNPKALVIEHNVKTGQVIFNRTFLSFCEQHGTKPRACKPFRAQTKGKIENGVGYLKKNALAGQEFESFAALESYLIWWMREVSDIRIHGTTHERPIDRFEADQQALLPVRIVPRRLIPEQRKVSIDCFINIATNRYSVPYQYVGKEVDVLVNEGHVSIHYKKLEIARHLEAKGRHRCILNKIHTDGLRQPRPKPHEAPPRKENSAQLKESPLAPYAALQGGAS